MNVSEQEMYKCFNYCNCNGILSDIKFILGSFTKVYFLWMQKFYIETNFHDELFLAYAILSVGRTVDRRKSHHVIIFFLCLSRLQEMKLRLTWTCFPSFNFTKALNGIIFENQTSTIDIHKQIVTFYDEIHIWINIKYLLIEYSFAIFKFASIDFTFFKQFTGFENINAIIQMTKTLWTLHTRLKTSLFLPFSLIFIFFFVHQFQRLCSNS